MKYFENQKSHSVPPPEEEPNLEKSQRLIFA
jgi:hypothetical protein